MVNMKLLSGLQLPLLLFVAFVDFVVPDNAHDEKIRRSVVDEVDDDRDMNLVLLSESSSPGGRCMDGTMAGYYIRRGTNTQLFVIELKGGGACQDKSTCDRRSTSHLGSSRNWNDIMQGNNLLNPDCDDNPDFCDAVSVHIPYCTSDTHRGNLTDLSLSQWGYYFDGHANFILIVQKLIQEEGLGQATHVLLTGSSAGGIGALFNVDWLKQTLPENTTVKAVPNAGWFYPGSLPNDLPDIFAPSDYPHFRTGTKGSRYYDMIQRTIDMNIPVPDVWQMRTTLPSGCLEEFGDDDWWACWSAHEGYKYIESPVFIIHSQYDQNQIFVQQLTPPFPPPGERDTVLDYIAMWGVATRSSLQQILDDDHHSNDGVFSASCLSHGTGLNTLIDGQTWLPIVRDWFFELGQLESYYKLIETCPDSETRTEEEDGTPRELPCNAGWRCMIPSSSDDDDQEQPLSQDLPFPSEYVSCVLQLWEDECLQPFESELACLQCAREHQDAAAQAGCTVQMVVPICGFVSRNDMDEDLTSLSRF